MTAVSCEWEAAGVGVSRETGGMAGMGNARLTVASWILLALAAVFFGLVGALLSWSGRIEATLLVFGKLVFVALDATWPRGALLLALPAALAATAFATRKPSKPR